MKIGGPLLGLMCLLCLVSADAQTEGRVVIVVNQRSHIASLSSLELRKVYLGHSVWKDGKRVRALRNASDPLLKQIFLQSALSMSERAYERYVLAMALRSGVPRPTVVEERARLEEILAQDINAISYMWEADARHASLRVLKVVWQPE